MDFNDADDTSDGCVVRPESEATLAFTRSLLGFDEVQFDKVLRFRRLVVGTEVTMRRLKAEEVGCAPPPLPPSPPPPSACSPCGLRPARSLCACA